jgi:membrane carboxypeptidase/penicillin-binding protein
VVLKRLVDLGQITPQQRQALGARLPAVREPSWAPHYLAFLRAQLVGRYGADLIEQGGLDIQAALDLELQKLAEQVVREGVKAVSPDLQGALLCLDPATGDVLAAVGDAHGSPGTINRAFSARRQPGSALKPLIYAAALEKGITAGSLWDDAPATYDRGHGATWKPLNYGGERFGELSLRQALAYSNNVITVKVLEEIGVPGFVAFASRMGLALHPQSGLSLALGTDEVTLNELVQAYTPLVTGGLRAEARTILRIHDRQRQAWMENPPALSPVLSPATAFVTTQLLKDVLTYGTAKTLRKFSQEHPSAGKTGTTDNYVDAWFIGYTPQLITGVWVGYDQPRPGGKGFTGGTLAAPIWERFMRKAIPRSAAEDFPLPEGVVTALIDPSTGLLATALCPKSLNEFYLAGTEPTGTCPKHGEPPPVPGPPPETTATP